MEWSVRQTGYDRTTISTKCLQIANSLKIHTLFTRQNIDGLSLQMFSIPDTKTDIDFRDFILSVTDTFFIEIEGNIETNGNESNAEYLINILTKNLALKFSGDHITAPTNLMPREVAEMLYGKGKVTLPSIILQKNDWLVVIMMMIVSISELTVLFAAE
jgi:hypothetical protein